MTSHGGTTLLTALATLSLLPVGSILPSVGEYTAPTKPFDEITRYCIAIGCVSNTLSDQLDRCGLAVLQYGFFQQDEEEEEEEAACSPHLIWSDLT